MEKCERLGVKKSSLVNEEKSNDEEDETLPFGIAMGLGGILDPREKDNSTRNKNSRSNSGNSGLPTKNNKSVGAVLRKVLAEHENTAIHNRHPRARHVESLKQKDVVNALFHLHRHFEINGDIPADESVLLHELISAGGGGSRSSLHNARVAIWKTSSGGFNCARRNARAVSTSKRNRESVRRGDANRAAIWR